MVEKRKIMDEQAAAATKIGSIYRGKIARREVAERRAKKDIDDESRSLGVFSDTPLACQIGGKPPAKKAV